MKLDVESVQHGAPAHISKTHRQYFKAAFTVSSDLTKNNYFCGDSLQTADDMNQRIINAFGIFQLRMQTM